MIANSATIREATVTLGESPKTHGARYYAQGKYLLAAGFLPGVYLTLERTAEGLVIRPSTSKTDHKVSAKANGTVSVIDLTAKLVTEMFGVGASVHVRVYRDRIVIAQGILDRRAALRPRDGSMASLFAGGGLGDLAGRLAGYTPTWAVEIDEAFCAVHEQNFPGARVYHMGVEEALMLDLPSVEVLAAGIPCEPWSRARTKDRGQGEVKRDRSLPATAHPLGHLTMVTFAIIARINPRTVVLEEAPAWLDSESGVAMAGALRAIGYHVESKILNPGEHGYLMQRRRAVMIAVTPNADGTLPAIWPEAQPVSAGPYPTVGDAQDADVPDTAWFTAEDRAGWVLRYSARKQGEGTGFGVQPLRASDTTSPVWTKRQLDGQGSGILFAHPSRPDTFRWPTLSEFQRMMSAEALDTSATSKTTAGHVLGQGWHVGMFRNLFATLRAGATASAPSVGAPAMHLPLHVAAACDATADVSGELPLFAGLAA